MKVKDTPSVRTLTANVKSGLRNELPWICLLATLLFLVYLIGDADLPVSDTVRYGGSEQPAHCPRLIYVSLGGGGETALVSATLTGRNAMTANDLKCVLVDQSVKNLRPETIYLSAQNADGSFIQTHGAAESLFHGEWARYGKFGSVIRLDGS